MLRCDDKLHNQVFENVMLYQNVFLYRMFRFDIKDLLRKALDYQKTKQIITWFSIQ